MYNLAIILAAGKSTRFGLETSKQVFLLNGKPVYTYALEAFNNCEKIKEIALVTDESHLEEIRKYVNEHDMNKVHLIIGGETRQDSVSNGLKLFECYDDDSNILIHDAARPLIDNKVIMDMIDAINEFGAVSTAISMEDTVAVSDQSQSVLEFVDRKKLFRIQTPQGFKLGLLREAHKISKDSYATDDCSLVMALPHQVKLIPGSKKLTKITTIEDISYLETYLK